MLSLDPIQFDENPKKCSRRLVKKNYLGNLMLVLPEFYKIVSGDESCVYAYELERKFGREYRWFGTLQTQWSPVFFFRKTNHLAIVLEKVNCEWNVTIFLPAVFSETIIFGSFFIKKM